FSPVQGNDPGTVLIRGGSCIVSPLGRVLAGPHFGEETILVAELDGAEIAMGKYDFVVVGHYARPDVFSLSVNRREAKALK
ncbi:MAG: nitrilase-related carbon-nitrogen hydrolase, partial [Myxococcota bacterium]